MASKHGVLDLNVFDYKLVSTLLNISLVIDTPAKNCFILMLLYNLLYYVICSQAAF